MKKGVLISGGTRRLIFRIGLLVGGGIFLYQLWIGLQALSTIQVQIEAINFLLISICLLIAALFVQIIAWNTIMEGQGIRTRIMQVATGYMLSFVPRYIPGTVWGYLSRNEWLYQSWQVPFLKSNLMTLLELGMSITASLTLIICFAFFRPDWFIGWWIIIVGLAFPIFIWIFLRAISKIHLLSRLLNKILPSDLFDSISFLSWVKGVVIYIIYWSLQGIAVYVLLWALNPVKMLFSLIDIFQCIADYGLAWLIGFLVLFAPAGVGFRETALGILMGNSFSIPGQIASIIAVIFRIASLLAELVYILIGILKEKVYKKFVG